MSECRSGRNALVATYHAVQASFAWFGCQLAYVRRRPHIPDVALYHPTFQPWLSSEWTTRLRVGDPRSIVSPDRKYVLYNLLKQSLASGLGDVAECGVYKGGTAYILADLVRSAGRTFFLFDTFAGMPETDPEKDLHKRGDFDDTSLDDDRLPTQRLHRGCSMACCTHIDRFKTHRITALLRRFRYCAYGQERPPGKCEGVLRAISIASQLSRMDRKNDGSVTVLRLRTRLDAPWDRRLQGASMLLLAYM